MAVRVFAALLGVFHLGNGLYMALAPAAWFATAPGASGTGPFNPHFVADVGFAFLAAGAAFMTFAWRPRLRLIAFGASGFLVLHGFLHVADAMHGGGHAGIDLLAVAIPGIIGAFLARPGLRDTHAQSDL